MTETYHTLLPQSVQRALKQAAAYDVEVPPGESFERTRRVDAAANHARLMYPGYFQPARRPGWKRFFSKV